jgi:NhaP-type Na+/H+ or K+/H+ antiporter
MEVILNNSLIFFIIGGILIIGFFADYIFKRYRIPDVIILLLVGLLLNFFKVKLVSQDIIPIFSSLALMFILFEVGTNLKFYYLIKEIPKASLLAFTIFFISMVFTSILSVFILNWDFEISLLLGAIVGGSSSAVVAPIMSRLDISKNTKSLLTIESTITDALCVLVAITLLKSLDVGVGIGFIKLPTEIISSFSIAIVLGFIFGLFWVKILSKIEKYEYYYLLTIGMLFIIYSLTNWVGGIGAISSLIFGIVLGNVGQIGKILYIKDAKPLTPMTNTFHKLIVFIIRSFFFVVLGLIITINYPVMFLYGIFLTFVLLAIRIIFSKITVLGPNKLENNMIAIMMPRGLAAAVLAPLPYIQYKITNATFFPDIVFSIILVSSILSFTGLLYLEYKYKSVFKNNKKL